MRSLMLEHLTAEGLFLTAGGYAELRAASAQCSAISRREHCQEFEDNMRVPSSVGIRCSSLEPWKARCRRCSRRRFVGPFVGDHTRIATEDVLCFPLYLKNA